MWMFCHNFIVKKLKRSNCDLCSTDMHSLLYHLIKVKNAVDKLFNDSLVLLTPLTTEEIINTPSMRGKRSW